YFLKIDGVPGESQDAKHKDEIQVLWFRWSEVHGHDTGNNQSIGKIQMKPFECAMTVCKASPKLYLKCAQNDPLGTVVFTARKAGRDQQDYLKLTFSGAELTEYELASDPGADLLPVNRMKLIFRELEVEYKPQFGDGKLGAAVRGRYNLVQMQAT